MTPYEIAIAELGIKEVRGNKDNDRIVEFHDYTSLDAADDETAWCSAFVNYCVAKSTNCVNGRSWVASGFPGTGKANARSWLDYGESCLPERGVIAVLWRGSPESWKGHVGFVCEPDDGRQHLLVLGGNQSNAVTIQAYPRNRVLGYRR